MTYVAFPCYCHDKVYWDSFGFRVPHISSVSTVCVAGGLLLCYGCPASSMFCKRVCRVPQSQTSLPYFYCCIHFAAWGSLSNLDSSPKFHSLPAFFPEFWRIFYSEVCWGTDISSLGYKQYEQPLYGRSVMESFMGLSYGAVVLRSEEPAMKRKQAGSRVHILWALVSVPFLFQKTLLSMKPSDETGL